MINLCVALYSVIVALHGWGLYREFRNSGEPEPWWKVPIAVVFALCWPAITAAMIVSGYREWLK